MQAGHVALGPPGREVLDGALLVGQEDEHVHARHVMSGSGSLSQRVGAGRGGARADQHSGTRGRGLQQVAASEAALRGVRIPVVVGVIIGVVLPFIVCVSASSRG